MSFCNVAKALASLDRPAALVKTSKGLDLVIDGRPLLGVADEDAVRIAEEALREGKRVEADGVVAEPVAPKPLIVLVGFGEVAKALAKVAKAAGYMVVSAGAGEGDLLVDVGELDDGLLAKAPVIIATEGGSPHDLPLFIRALRAGSPYVALLASRQRAAYYISRALKAGVPLEEIKRRAYTPAGLDIGARTPGEIALSILAEAAAAVRGATAKHMREVKDPLQILDQAPEEEPKCAWRGGSP